MDAIQGDECNCNQCLDCDARNYHAALAADVEDDDFITVETGKAMFARAGVIARIKHVLVTVSCVPLERMIDSTSLEQDLELDSLERIEAAQALEEEFGIALSDDEVDQSCMGTIGGIVDYLMTQRGVA